MDRKATNIVVSTIGLCLALSLLSVIPASCGKRQPLDGQDTIVVQDREMSEELILDSVNYKSERGPLSFSVRGVYPAAGPDWLTHSVRRWMNEQMGGTYEGNLADTAALFHHYAEASFSTYEEEDLTWLTEQQLTCVEEIEYKFIFEDDSLTTFLRTAYTYQGGAHGGYSISGATFRKIDGYLYGWDIVRNDSELKEEIKQGLKDYFEVETDEQLMECMMDIDVKNIPLPHTAPWIEKDGLHFVYQQYEIACYAAGMPAFVIPRSRMMRYILPRS